MTAFDGQVVGTPESDWTKCAWLQDAPELPALSAARLVVLAAHPDDETLGAGGLIARSADTGIEVHIIVASDGAASHPDSPTHSPTDLARVRKKEVAEAVHALAPEATIEFLDLPDGELMTRIPEITDAVRAAASDRSTLAAPWLRDRHPDHEACARAARQAAAAANRIELLEYPIWAWHWGNPATELASLDPDATHACRLSLDDDLRQRKQRAISAYVSQVKPLSPAPGDNAVLAQATLEYFARDSEYFFRIDPSRGRSVST